MPRDVDKLIPPGDNIADRLRRRREKLDEGDPEAAAEEMRKPRKDDNMAYLNGLDKNRDGYTKD